MVSGGPAGDLVFPEPGAGEGSNGKAGGGAVSGQGTGYESAVLGGVIAVYPAEGGKCERCWKYHAGVGEDAARPGVCPRCAEVLRSLPQAESTHA